MSTETAAAFYVTRTYNRLGTLSTKRAPMERETELSNRGCKCENRNRFAGHRMDSDGGTSETFVEYINCYILHGYSVDDRSGDKGSCCVQLASHAGLDLHAVLVSIAFWG